MSKTSGTRGVSRVDVRTDGPPQRLGRWLLANQAGLCLGSVGLLVLAAYVSPEARPLAAKFLTLSHYNPNTGKYALGPGDYYFVAFSMVLLIGLRAAFMSHILTPTARRWGISKEKEVARFSEQGWTLCYYGIVWPLGMFLYYRSPSFLSLEHLWTDWPERELDGLMKGYTLVQLSYWTQQVYIVQVEERRKDYWQIMAHHAVTIFLIVAAYAYHQTRVGTLILVLMDAIELIFPLAKCLKYLGYMTACNALFGLFVVTWLATRHVAYLMICWSLYKDGPRIGGPGCFQGPADALEGPKVLPYDLHDLVEPFHNPAGTVCMDKSIFTGFLVFLLALQGTMIIWSFFIVQVVIRVLSGNDADDIRSDDEEDEETEKVDKLEDGLSPQKILPIEEEVGVDGLNFELIERRNSPKRPGNSSGFSMPGHSDRKEILNRIGCEKQIN